MVNIDPKMDLVPEVLMNWGMKNIGGAIMGFIKKAAENLPEGHRKKIEENPDFYRMIKEKLEEINI